MSRNCDRLVTLNNLEVRQHLSVGSMNVAYLSVIEISATQGYIDALSISGNLNIAGQLSIAGQMLITNTQTQTSEQVVITNTGTGPALLVNQDGANVIAQFNDDSVTVVEVVDGGQLRAHHTMSTTTMYADNASVTYLSAAGFSMIPPGCIMAYGGASAPGGWFACDGATVSRVTYSGLYAAIGTTYGVGDGFSTFNLPNMQGRMIVGQSSSGSFTSRGGTGGSESITLTTGQMPSHSHTGTVDSSGAHTHGITDPGHTHTQTTINDDFNNSGANPPGFSADSAGSRTWSNISTNTTGITVNSGGAHTHTFTTNTTGSGDAIPNMSPYIVIPYIIKW